MIFRYANSTRALGYAYTHTVAHTSLDVHMRLSSVIVLSSHDSGWIAQQWQMLCPMRSWRIMIEKVESTINVIIMMNNDAWADSDSSWNARRSTNVRLISAQQFGVDHSWKNQSDAVTRSEKLTHQSRDSNQRLSWQVHRLPTTHLLTHERQKCLVSHCSDAF